MAGFFSKFLGSKKEEKDFDLDGDLGLPQIQNLGGLNPRFKTNKNFDDDSNTSAVEDALSIQQTLDYPIILAAWEEYAAIKKKDDAYDEDAPVSTPAWKALDKLIKNRQDFQSFTDEDLPLLQALANGFLLYSDVLHVLIDHHDDAEAGKEILNKHPELRQYLPEDYADPNRVLEIMVEVVKDYQWQLEKFSLKHAEIINIALERLGAEPLEVI